MELQLPPDTDVEYVFVDDGSADNTFELLSELQQQFPKEVTLIKLKHNAGSFNAFRCGLEQATGKCVVHLVADLQDPPDLIPEMYTNWLDGDKLVIATRNNREDPFSTRFFAGLFHSIMHRFSDIEAPKGGFDLVLMDREVVDKLLATNTNRTHIFYAICNLGYEYESIPYLRRKREVGKSGWSFQKKLRLFTDSIYTMTDLPVRFLFTTFSFLVGTLIVLAFLHFAGDGQDGGMLQEMMIVGILIGVCVLLYLFDLAFRFRLAKTRQQPAFEIAELIKRSSE